MEMGVLIGRSSWASVWDERLDFVGRGYDSTALAVFKSIQFSSIRETFGRKNRRDYRWPISKATLTRSWGEYCHQRQCAAQSLDYNMKQSTCSALVSPARFIT